MSAPWYVYLIECRGGRLYTGITPDLQARFDKHVAGKGALFTRLNRPERMIAAKLCDSASAAARLEHQLKGLTATQKRYMASLWPPLGPLPSLPGNVAAEEAQPSA